MNMSQQEILDKVKSNPGIRQTDVLINGNESKMITQLVIKGCIRREVIRTPRNYYTLYPTGEML